MTALGSDIATITVTPNGVEPPARGMISLALVTGGELQLLDRALREYNGSDNRLLNASADLLAVCGTLSRLNPEDELNLTRVELSRAIIDLKFKIARLDYPPSVAENLCLLFAIVIDEFIMASHWGTDSNWGNRALVADLFGFRDGGYRFYNIADRALMQPRALHEFIEIIYIFLKLGFRGKFRTDNEQERDRLIDRLEAALNLMRPDSIETPAKQPGRAVEDGKPPARAWLLPRKLLLTGAALAAMLVVAILTQSQLSRSTFIGFEARRAAAADVKPTDFVFSSQTGITIERPRE